MSIPNKKYQYLHDLVDRLRKKKTEKDLEELHIITHQLLGAAMRTAFEIRTSAAALSELVRESDKLSLWERVKALEHCANSLEDAARYGGGYKEYPDTSPSDYQP